MADFRTKFLLDALGSVLARLPAKHQSAILALYEVWMKVIADRLLDLVQTDLAKAIFKVPVEFRRECITFKLDETTLVVDLEKLERGGGVTINAFTVADLTLATVPYWIEIMVDPADASQTRVRIFDSIADVNAGDPLGESFSPGFGTKVAEPIAGFGGAPDPAFLKEKVRVATIQHVALDGTAPVYTDVGGASLRGQITWGVGPVSLDGVALVDGDRMLLKNEGDVGGLGADANGLWVRTAAATWDRTLDFDNDAEALSDSFVGTSEGAINADKSFQLTTPNPITIGGVGGTALTWTEFAGAKISYTFSGKPACGALIRRFPSRFAYRIDSEIDSIPELFPKTDIGDHSPLGAPLTEAVDYVVGVNGQLVFLVEPAQVFQFAKILFQNRQLVFDNFGFLIDFFQPNSRTYRRATQGLWFAFWNGPTVSNIELGAAIVLGFPISAGGRVLEINDELLGAKSIVVQDLNGIQETFQVRAEFVPFIKVEVGFESDTFFPLVVPFEVLDYVIDKNIHTRLSFPAPQRFFQWFVFFDAALWTPFIEDLIAAGEPVNLDAVGNFINRIEPEYTRGVLATRLELFDEISLATSLDEDIVIVNGEARVNQNWVNYLFLVTYQIVNGETLASYIGGARPDWDLDTDVISLVEHITISDLPIDGGTLIYEEPAP